MAEKYFILTSFYEPICIGDHIIAWIDWHVNNPVLSWIGEWYFQDGGKILTWFYGSQRCLWETLFFDKHGVIDHDASIYYQTREAALEGHRKIIQRWEEVRENYVRITYL